MKTQRHTITVAGESNEHVQIRVYRNFTEVRENLGIGDGNKHCKVTIPEEKFNQIIPNSMELECDKCIFQTVTKKSINLEGQTVYVRRNRMDSSEPEIRKAVLLRGNDWLVKDLETQRFYNVGRHELEFNDMPTENVYDVEFFFDHNCNQKETILRYQLRSVQWRPKYELSIIDDIDSKDVNNSRIQAKLKCVAVLENNSPTNYLVEKAELFGGQVQIQEANLFGHKAMFYEESTVDGFASAPVSNFGNTEISGIYMYELLNAFLMNAYSSSYIEFIRPKVEVEELSVIQLTNPTNNSGPMNRMYTLVTEEFIPSGYISIRQSDRLIGGHDLQDLPAKEKREISLGTDSAAVYKREEIVSSHKEKQTNFAVSLELINNHTKSRRFRLRETINLHRINTIFEIPDSENIKLIQDGIEINVEIASKCSSHFKYSMIKFEVQTND
ncbi:hypothetical protein GJ496_003839 [Pomphorhynchus laevis]|nr:hypothetical protein GJ496_003839 [Pomphorhynchus laevis]